MDFFTPVSDLILYRKLVNLDGAFEHAELPPLSLMERNELTSDLVDFLLKENGPVSIQPEVKGIRRNRSVLRALLNLRRPGCLNGSFVLDLNRLLQDEARERGIIDLHSLAPVRAMTGIKMKVPKNIFLWKGDIVRLKADAIVNAANSRLLGCFVPLHSCVDNAIHSASGPQLRDDCHSIMAIQAGPEYAGNAKITRAYNLPSRFVIHTVGPDVRGGGSANEKMRSQLASCYVSCLELAGAIESIRSIAFCCISTGLFGFPKKQAAETAVNTVNDWLEKNPARFDQVVFCVFTEEDHDCYVEVFKNI